MRRAFAMASVLLLAACSSGGDAGQKEAAQGKGAVALPAAAEAPDRVACALAGSRTFTAECKVERSNAGGKAIVTVRHPDGGFRRLIALDGGKRFAAADGSEEVSIERNGAEIEVTLGDGHYLFPAPANDSGK